jgi:hypothetical protein
MPSKSLLFKLDGHSVVPVDNVYEWCEWMDAGNLGVDYTSLGGYGLCTIFLGLPAPRAAEGPPLLFETTVIRGGVAQQVLERYATWDDAEKGHAKWTKAAKERRLPMASTFQ